MNIDETEILLDPKETHRSEVMALGRTVMANERTFLAFFRTASVWPRPAAAYSRSGSTLF